jgi:hypothetical protein
MRINRTVVYLSVFALAAQAAWAQEAGNTGKMPIPVRVTVVFKEYQGGKLLSNLPYILSVNAGQSVFGPYGVNLRMGLKVPVSNGNQIEYSAVGTNIDCGVKTEGGGRYLVRVAATRNSVVGGAEHVSAAGGSTHAAPVNPALGNSPIFDNSSMTGNLLMRDGQTIQSLMATNPVTGRVLKVDVTLNVVK